MVKHFTLQWRFAAIAPREFFNLFFADAAYVTTLHAVGSCCAVAGGGVCVARAGATARGGRVAYLLLRATQECGDSNIDVSDWIELGECDAQRIVFYSKNDGSVSTRCIETQRYQLHPDGGFALKVRPVTRA